MPFCSPTGERPGTPRAELTKRGVDFIVRQVAADRGQRQSMRQRTGTDEIPVLIAGDQVIAKFEEILSFPERNHPLRPDAQ
ncbi:MAG: hypothetical protein HY332_23855 [Chloroflexi bacterium]|nr:hypothetical protein [Chloroflexota bacterium]